MPYTAHTKTEIKEMLDTIGLASEDNLFDDIPKELKAKEFNVPAGLDEFSVFEKFKAISQKNQVDNVCFMGGGYYDHIIPSAVDALAGRSEFYTAYTPYQAEASQGTLQSLYEFQTLICELTGMEVSNASLYDGGTAMAEAALMAVRITKRNKILIDGGVNPEYIKIVQTYLSFRDIECEIIECNGDSVNTSKLQSSLDDTVASYIFANPNFFGSVQDFNDIVSSLHANKSLAIMAVYPISMGLIQDPGSLDVDIVCGDGQSLGNYLNFAGPSFGILATKQQYVRDVPGRIIGKTTDKNDKEMFVLTMQAREQHIRRHRATSNICTNQNLLALRGTIFMSVLGQEGLCELANTNFQKSEYLKEQLGKIDGVKIANTNPTFNEFIIETSKEASEIVNAFSKQGLNAGINLGKLYDGMDNKLLIAVTEKRTKEQMDLFVDTLRKTL